MPYYRVCERCGAHLDPGETCDCGRAKIAKDTNVLRKRPENTVSRPGKTRRGMNLYAPIRAAAVHR